jgi:DNA-binding NtrC family response regulator
MATEKVIDMFLWLEENKQKKPFRRKKILIVDDDLGPRESIRILAKVYGATTVTANDVYEALKILDTHSFDLITTCLRMPGLSGIDFIKEIRARGLNTPIIVITGFATLGEVVTKLGVIEYITKPFKVDNLKSAFNKALER